MSKSLNRRSVHIHYTLYIMQCISYMSISAWISLYTVQCTVYHVSLVTSFKLSYYNEYKSYFRLEWQ